MAAASAPAGTSTRDRILDAYEEILIDRGERAATLEAVAEAAQVSKGGLLYHFGSKAALVDGLLGRLRALLQRDLERMSGETRQAIDHYLRMSAAGEDDAQTSLAAQSLVLAGDQTVAVAVMEMERAWLEALEAQTGDPLMAKIIQLVGDGLYFGTSLARTADAAGAASTPARTAVVPEQQQLDAIIATLLDIGAK